MRPGRNRMTAAVAGVASLLALAAPAPGAAAQPFAESFSGAAGGWREGGGLQAKRARLGRERVLALSTRAKQTGRLTRRLPTRRFALSLDVSLGRGTTLELSMAPRGRRLRLARATKTGLIRFSAAPRRGAPKVSANSARGRWVHLQLVRTARGVRGSVGGQSFALRGRSDARLRLALPRSKRGGRALLDNLVVTSLADRELLLLHRLADLQARVPAKRFLVGAGADDRLALRTRFWTRGFLAGALWHARALTPGSDLFAGWALARTTAAAGYERADSHDVGMIYEYSAIASLPTACGQGRLADPFVCTQSSASAKAAADTLVALGQSAAPTQTIPTSAVRPMFEGDTIVDSLMNVPLLYWATDNTGNPGYADLGARHVRRVAERHVRTDGSTFQSVHANRLTGQIVLSHTHQGIAATTTWARGQAWAVHGFTTSADRLRDRGVLATAEKVAGWTEANLPPTFVPLFDYSAPVGAPTDTSAGVITAAGLLRLADLCRRWAGACSSAPERWSTLGRRMLAGAMRYVSTTTPLGFFGGGVGTFGGSSAWDDSSAELSYSLHFALEAIVRARQQGAATPTGGAAP